jgi:hypothetical protein
VLARNLYAPSAGGERSSGGACVSSSGSLAVPQGAGGRGKRERAGPKDRRELGVRAYKGKRAFVLVRREVGAYTQRVPRPPMANPVSGSA